MNQGLRRKLDDITDALWAGGVTNPVTCIEQISYLIYLKLLDEEERELQERFRVGGEVGKSLFPHQAERYRWSKWHHYNGTDLRDFLRDEVFPYMTSLVKDEPLVAGYFRDAVLEIVEPNVLKQVVDELDAIDFCKLAQDVRGDIFEYFLTRLRKTARDYWQFYTPRHIRAFMVEMLDPDLGDTICDLSCGTGGFIIDYLDYILAKYSTHPIQVPIYGEEWLEKRGQTLEQAKKEIPYLQTYSKGSGDKLPDWKLLSESIYGFDVSRQMVRIATMNLVLHGIRSFKLRQANVLSEIAGFTEDDLRRRYTLTVGNPPFRGILPKDSIRQDLPTNSKISELLFLAANMKSLDTKGRCALLVPEGLLFASTSTHVNLRKTLVQEFELLAVVSLPTGVLPYTMVKTSVLIFRKPLDVTTRHLNQVWFYEVKNDGYGKGKIAVKHKPETPKENDIPDLLKQWKVYKESGFEVAPGVKTGTLLSSGSEEPRCWWASLDTIAKNDYNLQARLYKPQVAVSVPDDDPVELIRDVLAIEREISSGLEKLLRDLEAV
jgi:type I restriction enzyme M protein